MMIMGCDVGALATKTVVLNDSSIVAYDIARNEGRMNLVAEESIQRILKRTGISISDIVCFGGTGWGEKYILAPHSSESSVNCLAKGAAFVLSGAGTVADMGGLSTTIITVSETGRVLEYRTNDRCASGSGFFLELAAQALELSIEQFGPVSLTAKGRAFISAQCAVFGESEIVTHVNDGAEVADIAAGVNYSLGLGVTTMIRRLGVNGQILLTGGVAKNPGVVKAIEENLGVKTIVSDYDPQVIGAIGAAICARDRKENKGGQGS
jgi:predicted CoA-substrate-specific enzyme activase